MAGLHRHAPPRRRARLALGAAAALSLLLLLAAADARAQGGPGGGGAAFDLAQYRWTRRVLLLFAPSAGDSSYADEVRAFRSREAEVRERDLVLVSVLEAGASAAGDRPLSAADAAALRRRYRAPAGRFTAVLVGKDGHAALRSGAPIVADRLFPTIDAMPMRRAEMRRRGAG